MYKEESFHSVVLGVNHRTAKVSLRDSLALPASEREDQLAKILAIEGIREVVILSTCNRIEIYLNRKDGVDVRGPLERWWTGRSGVELDAFSSVCYYYEHVDAVRHLFRVASSLDSLVMGEGQILGQIREDFQRSQEQGGGGFLLNRLFQSAISLGKRVRTETEISQGAVSISFAAVELCVKILGKLNGCRVGVIGTGEMGELAARHLRSAGAEQFTFINRSLEGAQRLAGQFGGKVCLLENITEGLVGLDIVISCTAAPGIVLDRAQAEEARGGRSGSRVFVDIAAPRDIHPDVGKIFNTYLFCIDDLEQVVSGNRKKREEAAEQSLSIVDEEVEAFCSWYRALDVVPAVKEMRNSVQKLLREELAGYENGMEKEEYERLAAALRLLGNKILHRPTVELKKLAEEGLAAEASELIHRLFGGH